MSAIATLHLIVQGKDEASKVLGDIDKNGSNLAKTLGTIGLAAGGLGVAGAAGLFKLGESFDDAFDTIAVGTGATGQALADLQGNFKDVFTSVPTDMGSAATAIADLNTRTGATGDTLEDMSRQMLEMTRLTGGDLSANIASVTRVMGDWGVSAEDSGLLMDKLFKVSQSTGVGIDQLANNMVKFGAPMRQLGFDFDTTAALLGKFEKEGVNAELVMGSMRIALGKMAKDGIPAREGLVKTVDAIKNAGSASEANALALELFGARAGPDMAAAIREGRFAVDDIVAMMGDSEGAIMDTAAATADFGERWTIFKNKTLTALEPAGTAVLGFATKMADKLFPALEKVGGAIGDFIGDVQWVIENGTGFNEKLSTGVWADLAEAVGAVAIWMRDVFIPSARQVGRVLADDVLPVVLTVAGYIGRDLFSALTGVRDVLVAVWPYFRDTAVAVGDLAVAIGEKLAGPLETVFGFVTKYQDELKLFALAFAAAVPVVYAIAAAHAAQATAATAAAVATGGVLLPVLAISAAIAALAVGVLLLVKNWDELTEKYPILETITNKLKDTFEAFVDWIQDPFIPTVLAIATAVGDAVTAAVGFVTEHWPKIQAVIEPALEVLVGLVKIHFDNIKIVIETVLGVIQGIVDVFIGVFTGDWDRAWEGIKQIVGSAWEGIKGLIGNAIEAAKLILSAGWEAMKALAVTGWQAIRAVIGAALDLLKSKAGDVLDGVVGFFRDLPGRILSAIGDLGSLLYGVGQDIVQGLIDGIQSMAGKVTSIDLNPTPFDVPGVSAFGFAKGLWEVPGPRGAGDIFPAMLSPGEMVVPARQADAIRSGRGLGSSGGGNTYNFAPVIHVAGDGDESKIRRVLRDEWERFKEQEFGPDALAYGLRT